MSTAVSIGVLLPVMTRQLQEAGISSARLEARLLVGSVLGMTAAQVFSYSERVLNDAERAAVDACLLRRLRHEPMSHILGQREFWGLSFDVSSAVLTPRPDSETLIETVMKRIPERSLPLRCLDLGTGSGCLLLAVLSEFPSAQGIGTDLSLDALAVAQGNADKLKLSDRACFVGGFWDDALDGTFDIILSNPPYIRDDERADLEPEVAHYEPHLALFGGSDGLVCYRDLAPRIARRLAADGTAFLEIGAGQAHPVTLIFEKSGLMVVDIVQDLAGVERCLVVQRKKMLER